MLHFFLFMSHSRAFWGLNGCWILFGSILEPNADIYVSIYPWNHFKLIFQTRLMQFEKKIHTFFLLLRSSILKLMYLCNFRSPRFYLQSFSSPLNLLSNATGLTWFWFFKAKLCPISQNELIMDWFSRDKFYGERLVTFPISDLNLIQRILPSVCFRPIFREF